MPQLLNFLNFSAAPETHYKSILMFGGSNFRVRPLQLQLSFLACLSALRSSSQLYQAAWSFTTTASCNAAPYVMWCHVMLNHIMWCHVMLHHIMWCHVILNHIIWCHVMLNHIMWCHVASCLEATCLPTDSVWELFRPEQHTVVWSTPAQNQELLLSGLDAWLDISQPFQVQMIKI